MTSNPKFAYIIVSFDLIDNDPHIQALCDNALRKGGRPEYRGEEAIYPIEHDYLVPYTADYVIGLGGYVENYNITRYTPVTDLSASLDASIPESSIMEGDEGDAVTRQLTYQDVIDMDTTHAPLRDGTYYFNVMAHAGHRPLTLDEYHACDTAGLDMVLAKDIPADETSPNA